jgi:hypothetical protein
MNVFGDIVKKVEEGQSVLKEAVDVLEVGAEIGLEVSTGQIFEAIKDVPEFVKESGDLISAILPEDEGREMVYTDADQGRIMVHCQQCGE